MSSYITLKIYDLSGRLVATLADARQKSGYYTARWDGGKAASGVYFVRLKADRSSETGAFTSTRKLVLLH
ncbi:T9SS type A sorting domain-containing protein [candidate division TA06 bacterium]|nr:T9SS type A sorting domain-containing protein [candidate division TA06 bacterium]